MLGEVTYEKRRVKERGKKVNMVDVLSVQG
jgi:hypothetical protein